jgi:ABC-2 type transport system permease protein
MMYHLKATFATTHRILQQLSHDHRTVALIFVVPCLLLGLLRWLYAENDMVFNTIAPALLGVFPFVIMFIITSITTLRERTGGTMERLMALPIGKLDLVMGYMLAFGLLAIVQASLASLLLIYGLGLEIAGPQWFLILTALADALLGTALGLLVSAFARTEFQAVQFMPALVVPQILVCGLLMPLSQMPDALEFIAYCLPLTYAVDALNEVVKHTDITNDAWRDLFVVTCFVVGAVLLGALTLRRRSK